MKITINDDNLTINDVDTFTTKTRALLINSNNEILVCSYGDIYMLPGGKISINETIIDALRRELSEETGVSYNEKELNYLFSIEHYQKKYPKITGQICNRYLSTHYYVGKFKGITIENQSLSNNEKSANFKLELISLSELKTKLLNINSSNPRFKYFQKELLTVLEVYNNMN